MRIVLSVLPILLLCSGCMNKDNNRNLNVDFRSEPTRAVQFFTDQIDFTINPPGLNSVIKTSQEEYTIVDVRDAESYAMGHIPGAINMPYDEWQGFDIQKSDYPGLSKTGINYVYCYHYFCNLSKRASRAFSRCGYRVKELQGGLEEWENRGYKVSRS